MRINSNIMALNTYRQLGINQSSASKSMEKLSSGFRINRAGDDAAGLAISEKMRAQIRGLKQASRNAQDGISLLQTAEGALGETHSILQRMRELAVQSANDTNLFEDRSQIQKEINELTSEINRIGNATEFNTQKILKGAEKLDGLGSSILSEEVYQTSGGGTIPGTYAKVSVEVLGGDHTDDPVAHSIRFDLKSGEIEESGVFRIQWVWDAAPGYKDIVGNPMKIGDIHSVTLSVRKEYKSAEVLIDYMKDAIDAMVTKYGIWKDFSITTDGSNLIFESKVIGSDVSISVKQVNLTGLITPESISDVGQDEIYHSASTDIVFGDLTKEQVLGKGITINNQTIMFTDAAGGASNCITDFTVNIEDVTDNNSLVAAISDQLGERLEGVALTASDNTLIVTATSQAEEGNGIVFSDGAEIGNGANPGKFNATLQIGANASQQMIINISDMRAGNLGLAGYGEGFISNENKESALDVSSQESSSKAITVVDNAIRVVSAERSKLGAFQNRLEHTINNSEMTAQNLQTAESRIRDIEMAKEIMAFSRNNILQQAATTMLAQANIAPNSVLKLLG